MKTETKILDTLFRRIPPSQLLNHLRLGQCIDFSRQFSSLYQTYAPTVLSEYSLDENAQIYKKLEQDAQSMIPNEGRCTSPLLPLVTILFTANKMLTQRACVPLCRINQVSLWREMYLLLGQDVFTCAYLAGEDKRTQYVRQNFAWPAILATDHSGLNALLDKRVAENHQHLYGSSNTFALSWCSLMNYAETHKELKKQFSKMYQPFTLVEKETELMTTYDRARYACFLRVHLFKWLREPEGERYDWSELREFQPDLTNLEQLDMMRSLYGAKIPQQHGEAKCLDYALEEHIFQASPDAHYRALAGERHLLYGCFMRFLSDEMNPLTQMAFFLYLQLKALVRSEIIQNNHYVGFRNFANYQDRKTSLCEAPFYQAELLRMALNAPLSEGFVSSLETRISPRNTRKEYSTQLCAIDEGKYFADVPFSVLQQHPWKRYFLSSACRTIVRQAPYFFVYHFIKGADTALKDIPPLELRCRQSKRRRRVRAQAIAMAEALESSDYVCRRVRGIDAASHEIGCPPEVFATAFRFLRDFQNTGCRPPSLFFRQPCHLLSATYHAGEDFLDIASALRTIDEAVSYLDLRRGDRLGHALGLGVNVKQHYTLKDNRVYLSCQDRLDDLVWILHRAQSLNVSIDPHLNATLTKEAQQLLRIIYGKAITSNKWHIELLDYYNSMRLRGDDPQRYITMKCAALGTASHPFDDYGILANAPDLEQLRQMPEITGMYYYYHFGRREKEEGSRIVEVQVTPAYMYLLEQLQEAMQLDLARRGIAVECNPSSNVLIGTFGHYQHHPIYRFDDTGIRRSERLEPQAGQLLACINTDDLGVFDTSQTFEYALLFEAMTNICDVAGNPMYTEADILSYLEHLRQTGHNVVFPPAVRHPYGKEKYHVRLSEGIQYDRFAGNDLTWFADGPDLWD
ncbi:MAG: hypothetical protein IJ418_15975 [Clostridia bacterium]|nr:hypothetical protein [Clostridia bacterium]